MMLLSKREIRYRGFCRIQRLRDVAQGQGKARFLRVGNIFDVAKA